MKNLLNSIAVLALFALPALAQEQSDLDAFGITDDGATLDQVAPDDGSLPPALPAPDVATAPADPAADTLADPQPEPEAATETAPAVAPFEVPADWTSTRFGDYAFAYPAGWSVMQDNSSGLYLFNGDRATEQGGVFALALDRLENVMPPGANVTSETVVTLAGKSFRRMELTAQFDATHNAEMILMASTDPVDGSDHLMIVGMSMGKPLADYEQAIAQMTGTVRFDPPPPELETAMDGLLVYFVQEGWQDIGRDDSMVTYPADYAGAISVAKGDRVVGTDGVLADIPPGTAGRAAMALGQAATLYTFPGAKPEYVQGNSQVPGDVTLYLLNDCAPDGDHLALIVAGTSEAIASEAFATAVAAISLAEGTVLTPCAAAAVLPTAPEASVATGSVPDSAPESATVAPQPGSAAVALPLQVQVGGVTYLLPEGWQASYDSPDDKMWTSPDGRYTVLSFWWFPDEPLLGYDDIRSVENVIVDHEPVTRISSVITDRQVVQNVTERARADKKRFIFTLEGTGVDPAELQALHDQLVASLRFGAGFDPSKPVEFAPSVTGNAAPIPAPAPASDSATGPAGRFFTVNFADGLQGWAGNAASLSILPDGGPDGQAVLEVFAAGDGVNGYISANPEILLDLTGATGLAVTIRSQTGTYVDPYTFGGVGDVFLRSRGKTASIAFPQRVTEDWQTLIVDFNDPGWRLGGGATSVADVLSFVTVLNIRGEFVEGDAKAWISSVSLLSGSGDIGPAAAAPASGWTRYVNARFGTGIDYDAGWFLPLPAPENGDGQAFVSTDGLGWFAVFGQQNYDDLDPRAMMARDREMAGYDTVTYEASGKNWYVLSGQSGGDIFYRKAVVDAANGLVHVFEITYPPAQLATYDPIVTRMAKSLAAGG